MKDFTQKELVTLSNGIVSLIEIIDTSCNAEMKNKEHIRYLQEIQKKIYDMIKDEED